MKLRNKETGERFEINLIVKDKNLGDMKIDTICGEKITAKNFSYFFEDYEEPKEYWYVSCAGRIEKATSDEDDYNEKHIAGHKSIGNYFETKEEAEKAVEKLKAWKRLKNAGFNFLGWDKYYGAQFTLDFSQDVKDDLDLLFGGE